MSTWSWKPGDHCLQHWSDVGTIPAADFFYNPVPTEKSYRDNRGWVRYGDGDIISTQVHPPFAVRCPPHLHPSPCRRRCRQGLWQHEFQVWHAATLTIPYPLISGYGIVKHSPAHL